jgi:mRNA-degrading endonuclease toxin of MazEF toxin-antitoxin module
VNRGDVVQVDLSSGPRPAVVITADHLIGVLANVTVVEVTTTLRDAPTTVLLNRPDHGLAEPSEANAANIQTVPKSAVTATRGALSDDEADRLDQAVLRYLGLDDPAAAWGARRGPPQ